MFLTIALRRVFAQSNKNVYFSLSLAIFLLSPIITFYLRYSISPGKFGRAPLAVVYIYKAINVIVVWDGSTERFLCRADFSHEVTQCCEKPENIGT